MPSVCSIQSVGPTPNYLVTSQIAFLPSSPNQSDTSLCHCIEKTLEMDVDSLPLLLFKKKV